jgi:UDP:flavonoid glycosyltransferase YjiC (YdhE family)
MSSILFTTWDGGGNVPPALAIAAELRDRGHDLRFLGHAVQRDAISAAGFRFDTFETAAPFSSAAGNPPEVVAATFGDQAMGADLVTYVEHHPTDLVVIDCLLIGAQHAAMEVGLPYVSLEHLFDGFLRTGWLATMGMAPPVQVLEPERCWDAAAMCLVASLAELDTAAPARAANLRYSGPAVTGAPCTGGESGVLVSLSTYNFPGQTPAMQNILDALATIDTRVIVTTGPAIDPAELSIPANAEVHTYVPHAELMPQASLVVGHGGHATTMLALAHDLPVAVMPMHPMLDQPMVGQALEDAGAGRLLTKEAGPDMLRPILAELLAAGPHRDVAARLGSAIRAARGAATGADLIESLLSAAAPATARAAAADLL